ncbi:MAG: sigma-70 family RNA polymerase sigma factor [Anaerolineae bacterium]|nr:sigma-70 family RNA polymerase sigma factor [Anaerolineae bacterium]
MDDQDAITRIKLGDPAGLEPLVERYQVRAVSAAYLVLQERAPAEDVVQSAFLKVFDRIHTFDDALPFAPWFFRIVINDAVKSARERSRFSSLPDGSDEDARELAAWLVDPGALPEVQVEQREERDCLRRALLQLAPEHRGAVVMRYYLEMDAAEMAVGMDRPVSTVKWWLRAARKHLGAILHSEIQPKEKE